MNANDAVAVADAATDSPAADAETPTTPEAVEAGVAEPEAAASEAAEVGASETAETGRTAESEASALSAPEAAAPEASVPEPRAAAEADGEAERGKAKKPRRAVRAKSAGGTKALVVWREGRLHYADENVLVIDLDEAASPEVDVHDVVDRLAELREASESAGRAETVAALSEIIQEKALA